MATSYIHEFDRSGPMVVLDDTPPATFESVFDERPLDQLSDDELCDKVAGFASQIASLTARWLVMLVELDRRGTWANQGTVSCAHWLSWRTGLSVRTAQEHLRIGYALQDLPLISEAFAAGRLTYSKVRALTRVATAQREKELLSVALSVNASQLERLVREMRGIDKAEAADGSGQEPEPVESEGRWSWNEDGSLEVSLRLSSLDGARFLAGVTRTEYERTRTAGSADVPRNALDPGGQGSDAEREESPQEVNSVWRGAPRNVGPAVVAMAEAMATDSKIPEIVRGAEVVVHSRVDDEGVEYAHVDDGPHLDHADHGEAECGAAVRAVTSNRRGAVLRWGRKRRLPTHALMRAVFSRDGGCRHPACGRTKFLHAHHVREWSQGGTTDPDNLIMLCSTHHRALHRGLFSITAHGKQRFTFHSPDGAVMAEAPAMGAPPGWEPNRTVGLNATQPVGWEPMDLDYVTWVLYYSWSVQAAAADTETIAA